MIDFNKLSRIMKNDFNNQPIEIIQMQRTVIKIYPGGKIFPGKTQVWFPEIKIAEQKKPKGQKEIEVQKEIKKTKAW